MPTPSLSLGQLRSTPLGKKPIIEELTAIIDHLSEQLGLIDANEQRLTIIDGGVPPPVWPTAADTKFSIEEAGGSPNVYTAVIQGASASLSLIEGLVYWLHGSVTNTGASTLNVGSYDGAVEIKKLSESGLVDLCAGDMPQQGAQLYYSNANGVWILANPTSAYSKHTVVTTLGAASVYSEGEFVYVTE